LSPDPIRVSKALSKEKLHSSSLVGSGVKLVATFNVTWPNLSPGLLSSLVFK